MEWVNVVARTLAVTDGLLDTTYECGGETLDLADQINFLQTLEPAHAGMLIFVLFHFLNIFHYILHIYDIQFILTLHRAGMWFFSSLVGLKVSTCDEGCEMDNIRLKQGIGIAWRN